jgi:hypothetical protein
MSIENEVPVTTPATSHKAAAAAIIDEVRGLKDRIPHFVIPESRADRQRLARAASLPPEFIDLAAMATRNNGDLARGGDSGPDDTEDLRSYAEAYGPLADELEAMALFVRHSVRAAKNQAGSNALMTYAMASVWPNVPRLPVLRRTSRTCAARWPVRGARPERSSPRSRHPRVQRPLRQRRRSSDVIGFVQ